MGVELNIVCAFCLYGWRDLISLGERGMMAFVSGVGMRGKYLIVEMSEMIFADLLNYIETK